MNTVTYIFAVLAALATLAVILWMMRQGRLRERHAVWWIVASVVALILSVFPATLVWATRVLGFALPSNLIYFVSIAVLVLVCIQHSSELTRVEAQVRRLAEEVAILRMERDADNGEPGGGDTRPAGDTGGR